VESVKKEEKEDLKQQQISNLSRAISSAVQTEGMTKVLLFLLFRYSDILAGFYPLLGDNHF